MGLRPEDWPSVVSKDEASNILDPWRWHLTEPFFHGWKAFWRWQETDPEFYATVVPRTRASIVHDFAIRFAKEQFEGRESEGIRTRAEFESLLVIFGEDLVLRFKKFDNKEKASNSRTGRQWRFDRQCLDLPGIPNRATKVTAGYTLNEEQTIIKTISVSCWCINSHKWSVSLFQADDGEMFLNFPLPSPDAPDQPKRTIFKPVIEERKAEGEDESP